MGIDPNYTGTIFLDELQDKIGTELTNDHIKKAYDKLSDKAADKIYKKMKKEEKKIKEQAAIDKAVAKKLQGIGKLSGEAIAKKKDMDVVELTKAQEKLKNLASKKLSSFDLTLSGRAEVFHIFKAHKKMFKECGPCKHIMYFLKYEAKHISQPTTQPLEILQPPTWKPETIILKDDWKFNGGTASGTYPLGGTTTTTAGGESYTYNAPEDLFGAMTIDPSHPLMIVKSGEKSMTHLTPIAFAVNEGKEIPSTSEMKYETCTTNLKVPSSMIGHWKSHTALCDCGQVTLKWMV